MPTRDEHLTKAEHNEAFYGSFDTTATPFLDWIVTGLFYCGLHYIDAYLATINLHPRFHGRPGQRNDCVANMSQLQPIWPHYRALKDDSEDARYGFDTLGLRYFSQAEVAAARDTDLAMVRSHILQLLGMI